MAIRYYLVSFPSEVDENETTVVRGNHTNRDITCEDNNRLIASEKEVDRKLEYPKEGGIFDLYSLPC
ncbi:MAG: hypothetical protein PVI62_20435 [Desulfobacterales bacterium]|jgi:hypothetical protein